MRLAEDLEHEEVANCLWNTKTRRNGLRVGKLGRGRFAVFERAYNRCTAAGLHREHARSFPADPAQCFHFIKCHPHADETGAATGWIKNGVR